MPKEQPDSKFEQLQSGWLTSLTDPENHNPEDYRYLIHAFNTNKTSMALISAFTEQKYSQSGQKVEQTPVVDLLQSPERLREREAISCSLIDPDHYGTWGDCGIILGLEQKPIRVASEDIGTKNYIPEAIIDEALYAEGYHILSLLYQIKDEYEGDKNNEISLVFEEIKKQKIQSAGELTTLIYNLFENQELAKKIKNQVLDLILDKICQKQNIEPDKLLQNTYSSSYNEVVVRAKFAKLLGFFIKVYEDNDQPLNPEMAQIIRGKAKSLNLPVVEIKQPVKEIYSAGFDKDSNSYYINHGEYTIIIPIRNDESFYVYDRNGIGYFPDLDWVLEIFRLYKDKITDINENFVKEMYERQNTERLKLRVNFYKDGKIKSIYTKLGFGKKTQEYSISPAFKYTLSLNEEEIPFAHYRIEIGNEYERIRKANSGSPLELEEKVIGDFDENDKEDALKKLQEIEKVVLSKTQDNELIKKIQTFFEKIRREIKGEKQEEKQDLKNLLTPDFKKTDIDFSTLLNNLKNPKNK